MDGLGDWPLSELVPLVHSAARSKRPVAFVGIGVESLHRAESRRSVTADLAPVVSHWSVRGQRDCARLEALGVPPERITVAADMAWLLQPADTTFGRRTLDRLKPAVIRGPVIGVNLNLERSMVREQPRLTSIVAGALDRIIAECDAAVVFLCNEVREGETFDKAAALAVCSQMKRRGQTILVPNEYYSPQQMLSLVGCCDVTLSSRYHFCVFSALQGVPFLALNRSNKVEDLCLDLEATPALSLAETGVEDLCRQLTAVHAGRERMRSTLTRRVGELRDRARANLTTLDVLTA
jgi:polysaccharide pyruvyl transferase WcaK-like protein